MTPRCAWSRRTRRCAEVRRLTDELEIKNRELARKNRLADLGQMASHIAHEVRNNLVPVSLYLSLLRRRLSDDSGQPRRAGQGRGRLHGAWTATVNDLLNFTADRDPQLVARVSGELIDDVRWLAGAAIGGAGDRRW